jgi:hypothetical protein
MIKIKIYDETPPLPLLDKLGRRLDGLLHDVPALDGTQLGLLKDREEHPHQPAHNHHGQQLVVHVEQSYGPQLAGQWNTLDLGELPDGPLARKGDSWPSSNIELRLSAMAGRAHLKIAI